MVVDGLVALVDDGELFVWLRDVDAAPGPAAGDACGSNLKFVANLSVTLSKMT